MKRIFDNFLNLIPLLAPIPTGWAVYAGLVMQPTWPMPLYIAIPGAVALIAVSISVTAYIIDVSTFNKSLKRRDRSGDEGLTEINTKPGWFLFSLSILAEITLALLIGIIEGLRVYAVLAFPMLSVAGMFTFVLRNSLAERIAQRDHARAERRKAKEEDPQSDGSAKKSGRSKSQRKLLSEYPCAHAGAGCDRTFASQNAANAHARTCGYKPIAAMPKEEYTESRK